MAPTCKFILLRLLSWSLRMLCVVSTHERVAAVYAASSSTLFPLRPYAGGNRASDYDYKVFKADWTDPTAEIVAQSYASQSPRGYGALFYRLDASLVLGHRVMLEARVARSFVYGDAWAGMFVRVEGADGRVLAFDNMRDRPIRGGFLDGVATAQVVVQVPARAQEGGDETACPNPAAMPAVIVVGVFLCGGRGSVRFDAAEFKQVGAEHPVTGGTGPWSGPGLDDLGPGTLWHPGQLFPWP